MDPLSHTPLYGTPPPQIIISVANALHEGWAELLLIDTQEVLFYPQRGDCADIVDGLVGSFGALASQLLVIV